MTYHGFTVNADVKTAGTLTRRVLGYGARNGHHMNDFRTILPFLDRHAQTPTGFATCQAPNRTSHMTLAMIASTAPHATTKPTADCLVGT